MHGHHLGHHHPSLREQLQFTITNSAPQSTATTPGAPRTIFGRLGIRKPSILSLSSPQAPGGATARTFSLDDLLRPPPRRKIRQKFTNLPSQCKIQFNSIQFNLSLYIHSIYLYLSISIFSQVHTTNLLCYYSLSVSTIIFV